MESLGTIMRNGKIGIGTREFSGIYRSKRLKLLSTVPVHILGDRMQLPFFAAHYHQYMHTSSNQENTIARSSMKQSPESYHGETKLKKAKSHLLRSILQILQSAKSGQLEATNHCIILCRWSRCTHPYPHRKKTIACSNVKH